MQQNNQHYIVDFEEEINRFTKVISYTELPTIDIDVAVSQVCTVFEYSDIPAAIERVTHEMVATDWLIEHDAWCSKEEEVETRAYLHRAISSLAKDMFRKLHSSGLFPTATEAYHYRKPLNEHTIVFTRLPGSATA